VFVENYQIFPLQLLQWQQQQTPLLALLISPLPPLWFSLISPHYPLGSICNCGTEHLLGFSIQPVLCVCCLHPHIFRLLVACVPLLWYSSHRYSESRSAPISTFVLSQNLENTIDVDFKSHFNLRHATGDGGIPASTNLPRLLLSLAITRSPWRTWISTEVCPSVVENTWDLLVGIVVLRSMILVKTSPRFQFQ